MTMTTGAVPSEVARYVAEVAHHLSTRPGLADAERAELLDDLAQHLAEVAADGDIALVERLGSPEAYAEELLAAAGLGSPPAETTVRPWRAHASRLLQSERVRTVTAFARELEPAWWVTRGYLAASLLGSLTSSQGVGFDYPGFPIPKVLDSDVLGIVMVVAATVLSVQWGRGRWRRRPWVERGVAMTLAVYGVVLVASVGDRRVDVRWVDSTGPNGPPQCLTNGVGRPIENLYPYDAEGRLLEGVLLFDQSGRPLDNLCPQPYDDSGRAITTEYGQDENGAPVINVFPRRQTAGPRATERQGPHLTTPTTVEVPPPAVVVPRLATTTTTTPMITTTAVSPPPESGGGPAGGPTGP